MKATPLMRSVLWGWGIGSALDACVLLIFPVFFESWIELLLLPLVGVAVALIAHAIAALLLRKRRKSGGARRRLTATRFLIGFVAALAVPTLLFAPGGSRSWTVSPRVLMLCVDAATWDVLTPEMEAGALPNLRRLRDEGASGVLMSTDPSFSPVVWTTMATGRGPDAHGISSFYSTREHLRAVRFWDVLNEQGQKVGVFRWLITWPPEPVNGFIVPGILARDGQCYPPEYGFLQEFRIERKSGRASGPFALASYGLKFMRTGLRMKTCRAIAGEFARAAMARDGKLRHVALRRAEIRLNMDVYQDLLRRERPDFTSFYDNGTDVLGHRYWKYFEPEKFEGVGADEVARYGRFIIDYYALVDELIGDLLGHVDTQTTVMVVSDHGQKADTEMSHINLFPNTGEILKALDLDREFYGIVLGNLHYVESVKVDAAERARSLAFAAERLSAVRVQQTGRPLFNVSLEDDIRLRLDIDAAVGSSDQLVEVASKAVPMGDLVFTKPAQSGTHSPEGIIIVRGPGFRPGTRIEGASLVDIAPTVLYVMGQPLSRELEGEVLWSALRPELVSALPVRWVDNYDADLPEPEDLEMDEETMKTLRSLGYIR